MPRYLFRKRQMDCDVELKQIAYIDVEAKKMAWLSLSSSSLPTAAIAISVVGCFGGLLLSCLIFAIIAMSMAFCVQAFKWKYILLLFCVLIWLLLFLQLLVVIISRTGNWWRLRWRLHRQWHNFITYYTSVTASPAAPAIKTLQQYAFVRVCIVYNNKNLLLWVGYFMPRNYMFSVSPFLGTEYWNFGRSMYTYSTWKWS